MDPSADNVAEALRAAASRDAAQAAAASKQLDTWHNVAGFHCALQDIYLAKQLPNDLRLVALTQLKNGVEKHWKRGPSFSIGVEEQRAIRSRLLQDIFESVDDTRFAAFQALIIAKVARNDFPTAWPSLFEELTTLLSHPACTNNPERQTLVLTIIRYVIKELATVRIGLARQHYALVGPALLQLLVQQMTETLTLFFQNPAQNVTQGIQAINFLKCIRRLMVSLEAPHKDSQVQSFWETSAWLAQQVLDFVSSHRLTGPHESTWPGLLLQLSKMHKNMAESHLIFFALQGCTPRLVELYWTHARQFQLMYLENRPTIDGMEAKEKYLLEKPLIRAFQLRALSMLRVCFRIAHGSLPLLKYRSTEEEKLMPEKARAAVTDRILAGEFPMALFRDVTSTFLIYDEESLELWANDPEEWDALELEEDGALEISPRVCAERLLMDIALHHRDGVVGVVADMTRAAETLPTDKKESIYAALGATAPMAGQHFPFEQFLLTRLMDDLKLDQPEDAPLMRRRVAILISQFIPLGLSNDAKRAAYEVFSGLLEDENLVVRLTAASRLKDICDDFNFDKMIFAPFAGKAFRSVMSLCGNVSIPEITLGLLSTLESLVERMDSEILPFADSLVELLEPLWEKLEREQQMKKAVVGVLVKFVAALGPASSPLQPLVMPMIKTAFEPGSETQLYLLEDALELATELVRQTTRSGELGSIVPMMLPMLEMDVEICKPALGIVHSMLLLEPPAVLQDGTRQKLLQKLSGLLHVRSNEVVVATAGLLESLIRQAHGLDPQDGARIIVGDMTASGVLDKAFRCVDQCWYAHQTSGPNRKPAPDDARNETEYFSVLARLIYTRMELFTDALSSFATSQGKAPKPLLERLLVEWFSHFDNVGSSARRKLMAMALTTLLRTNDEIFLVRMQQMMTMWTTMLVELRDHPDDLASDSLVLTSREMPHGESPDGQRKLQWEWADEIRSVPLRAFVQQELYKSVEAAGGLERFEQQWLVNIDRDVLQAFKDTGAI